MSVFKKATKQGLRFETSKGVLTTEQLWRLSLKELKEAIEKVGAQLKKEDVSEYDFFEPTTIKNEALQLQFDVLKEVYIEIKSDIDRQAQDVDKKKHNEKIMALIAEKEEAAIKDKSVDELKEMLM